MTGTPHHVQIEKAIFQDTALLILRFIIAAIFLYAAYVKLSCTSHYSMCRTMTDELMACLLISWLAGARSSLLRIPRTLGLTERQPASL